MEMNENQKTIPLRPFKSFPMREVYNSKYLHKKKN